MHVKRLILGLAALLLLAPLGVLHAACHDNVVLVHGNTGSPSDFDNTRQELLSRGYSASQIFTPNWGSKTCAACNDHNGSEETPVANAIVDAIAASCTGKIDVIGHSMGATLAAHEIVKLGARPYVDTFVGIAGAFRGLWSCGMYPYNVWNATCGSWGLSVNSPFLNDLYGQRFGDKVYSIKSWSDEINCSTGTCLVYGVHTSSIWGEDGSLTYPYGHYGLLWYTAADQVNLIQ